MSAPKAVKLATEVVLILILVAAAAYLVESNGAGVQVYNVYPTSSMLPTLEVGDLVIVHSVPYASVQTGDVIVFTMPDQSGACNSGGFVIVHRVVNITAQGLITQGDNRNTNQYPDEGPPAFEWPPVPPDCVKGVVVFSLPYLGRITEAFPAPYNYLLVAAIVALILVLELRPNRREDQRQGEAASTAGKAVTLWRPPADNPI